jgi:hypothetical protein
MGFNIGTASSTKACAELHHSCTPSTLPLLDRLYARVRLPASHAEWKLNHFHEAQTGRRLLQESFGCREHRRGVTPGTHTDNVIFRSTL